MSRKQDRTVYLREDGVWVNQLNAPPWSFSLHPTRDEALRVVKENFMKHGGGDITLLAPDGTVEYQATLLPEDG